jgi:hypothetical protein
LSLAGRGLLQQGIEDEARELHRVGVFEVLEFTRINFHKSFVAHVSAGFLEPFHLFVRKVQQNKPFEKLTGTWNCENRKAREQCHETTNTKATSDL